MPCQKDAFSSFRPPSRRGDLVSALRSSACGLHSSDLDHRILPAHALLSLKTSGVKRMDLKWKASRRSLGRETGTIKTLPKCHPQLFKSTSLKINEWAKRAGMSQSPEASASLPQAKPTAGERGAQHSTSPEKKEPPKVNNLLNTYD